MAYYSFVVIAPQPIAFTKPLVMVDQGLNAFSVVVDDLDDLLAQFETEGVVVTQVNKLDEHDQGQPSDLLIEGEKNPLWELV